MTRLFRALTLAFCLLAGVAAPAGGTGLPIVGPDGKVPSLAPLVKAVTPSVVNIAVSARNSRGAAEGVGSGVIVDAQAGYVLTNQHVIAGADKIVVTLKDNRKLDAALVGGDPATDIALLRIEARNLTAVAIGDT